jgi:hypothetical protein
MSETTDAILLGSPHEEDGANACEQIINWIRKICEDNAELREKLRGYERMATNGVWVDTPKYTAMVEDNAKLRRKLEELQQPDPDADEALNRIVQSAAERIEHGLSYEGASSIEGIVRAAIKAARKHEKA